MDGIFTTIWLILYGKCTEIYNRPMHGMDGMGTGNQFALSEKSFRGYLDVPLPTYPYGKPLYKPYIVVFMGYNPQESLENTTNAMGTLLGVHPIVPWDIHKFF